MTDIILQGAQILSPIEYVHMREKMNPIHQLIFDGAMFTGMRMKEFWRFVEHPEWFSPDRQFIHLPPGSMLKERAKMRERQVILSNIGTLRIRDLVAAIKRREVTPITKAGWNQDMRRAADKAGVRGKGIVPKLTRKTWISWLMTTYPQDGLRIAASMGHDTDTLMRHYLSMPFTAQEREEIKTYVHGWGGHT